VYAYSRLGELGRGVEYELRLVDLWRQNMPDQKGYPIIPAIVTKLIFDDMRDRVSSDQRLQLQLLVTPLRDFETKHALHNDTTQAASNYGEAMRDGAIMGPILALHVGLERDLDSIAAALKAVGKVKKGSELDEEIKNLTKQVTRIKPLFELERFTVLESGASITANSLEAAIADPQGSAPVALRKPPPRTSSLRREGLHGEPQGSIAGEPLNATARPPRRRPTSPLPEIAARSPWGR
jgi:hypothetical protein